MKLTVVLTILFGTLILACSSADVPSADPTPNVNATVEARVDQEPVATPAVDTPTPAPTPTPIPTLNPTPTPTPRPTPTPTPNAWMLEMRAEANLRRQATDWFEQGVSLSRRGLHEDAIAAFDKAIEIGPEKNFYAWRGTSYQNLGQFENAIQDYTSEITLFNGTAVYYVNRGVSYANLSQRQNAIDDYTKAIQLDPNYAAAYNNRGVSYSELGDYASAGSDDAKACSLDNQYCNSQVGDGTATRLIRLGWNKPTSIQTTYLRTSDLSNDSVRVVEDGIRAGEDYLGTYGPLRVYVIGTDIQAAHIVAMDFCSWAYGGVNGFNYEYCVASDQGIEIREIAEYAGSNAFAQHSRNLETPNQSFVIGNPLQFESGLGSKIAIHEYVHIYQNANKVDEKDFGLPLWLEEGSAEFLALYLGQKKGWADFRTSMTEALRSAKDLKERHPDIGIQDIETSESRDALRSICDCTGMLQYETGQWATAWLVNRTSLDSFYKSYIPDIVELGGHGSFEKNFGLTVQEFYGEFDEFMSSSTGNQLAILPIP
jgi:tetratricopeptide (TPR) repeat protein